jgi:hypothetical protein
MSEAETEVVTETAAAAAVTAKTAVATETATAAAVTARQR